MVEECSNHTTEYVQYTVVAETVGVVEQNDLWQSRRDSYTPYTSLQVIYCLMYTWQ